MRSIREEEVILLKHMIELAVKEELLDSLPAAVDEYNPKQKESINLSGTDASNYGGDLLRVEYIDSDQVPLTITLTKDSNGALLDLDFWKEDFKDVLTYPTPDKVKIVR